MQIDLDLRRLRSWFRAEAAHRGLEILALDGGGDVGWDQRELVHPGGVEPDTHGIIEGAEQRRLADAGDTGDGVEHIDGDVVGDEKGVEFVAFAIELDEG